jgi:hypothetical protein
VLFALLAVCLWLPLGDVLAYPDRLSVLPNLQTDAETYFNLARDVHDTMSLGNLPPRHPPGWIAAVAVAFWAGGVSYVAPKVVLWLSLLASTAACAYLASRVYGRPAAWAGAVLCACSAALRGYVGTVQYEVFTAALLVAVFVLAVRTLDAGSRRQLYVRAIFAGLIGGVLILTRETFAVVVPLVAVWMGHQLKPRFGTSPALAIALLVSGVALAPPSVWSLVQSLRYGELITISEKGPMVIELGHNPRANGTYNAPLVGVAQPRGLAFVRAYPARSAVLAVRKALYFWGVLRDGWNVPRPLAVYLWRATTGLVPYEVFGALARGGWLLVVFAAALVLPGRSDLAKWWGLPASVLLIMLVHVATLSSHRFAVPILPVVFVVISGPIARACRAGAAALRSPLVSLPAAALLVIVVLMQTQAWPLRRDFNAADLDGLSAGNTIDPISRAPVRVAVAERGTRPVVLLTDEYMPRGMIRLTTRARALSDATDDNRVAARVSLVDLDGHTVCSRDIAALELPPDRFADLSINCSLPGDAVATLAVFSLGVVDFAVASLSLAWIH